jgi:hypothetical protein
MTARRQRGWLLRWAGALLCAGCSFPNSMYFLMPEHREPAEYKRLSAEDKKETKVVVWTFSQLDPRPEFIQADRQLVELFIKQLRQLFEENKEKVVIESPRNVENYKNLHPNWKSMDPIDVGKHFKADYVVNLELNHLSLYDPKAIDHLYQGRAEIQVSVIDVKHPDDSPTPHEFSDIYPNEPGSIDNLEVNPMQFREMFLTHVAKRLSFYFSAHQKRDRFVE